MKTISVANPSGGNGQTTTVVSLAGTLAADGDSVLIIETDPRAKISSYFKDKADPSRTLEDVFRDEEPAKDISSDTPVSASGIENISLILAGEGLADIATELSISKGMGLVIQKLISSLQEQYHYILISCPLTLNILMVNALGASDTLVIPVATKSEEPQVITELLNIAKIIETNRQITFDKTIVPTMHDEESDSAKQALAGLSELSGATLWDGVIPLDDKFDEAAKQGAPITEVDPRARGAAAYRLLSDTFS